jgi:hypothetical protein
MNCLQRNSLRGPCMLCKLYKDSAPGEGDGDGLGPGGEPASGMVGMDGEPAQPQHVKGSSSRDAIKSSNTKVPQLPRMRARKGSRHILQQPPAGELTGDAEASGPYVGSSGCGDAGGSTPAKCNSSVTKMSQGAQWQGVALEGQPGLGSGSSGGEYAGSAGGLGSGNEGE